MYDIIADIIDHAWQSNYTSDQQYIYYCCSALICILAVAFIDAIRTGFRSFTRK